MQLYAKENKGDDNRPVEVLEDSDYDFPNIKFSKTLAKEFRIESHKHTGTSVRELTGDYRSTAKLLSQLPTKNSYVEQPKQLQNSSIYSNYSNGQTVASPLTLAKKKKSVFTIKPKQENFQATQLYFHSPQLTTQKTFKIAGASPGSVTRKRFFINPQPLKGRALDF